MYAFHLEASIALAIASSVSCALHWLSPPQSSEKIRLATSNVDSLTPDPFDVLTVEDVMQGVPLKESAFWIQVMHTSPRQVVTMYSLLTPCLGQVS